MPRCLLLPHHDAHLGVADAWRATSAVVLSAASTARSDHFVNPGPSFVPLPTAACRNPPKLLIPDGRAE